MAQLRWLIAIGAIGAFGLGSAQAQIFSGHHAARSGGAGGQGSQQINCDVVAATPGSGMDKASCEAMNQAAASYYNAQHDPSASHPGDEQMSCADIKAEFMQQPVTAPPKQDVAAAQAATTDYMAKSAQLQAQATAQAAALSAQSLAASAASMANPIAGKAADEVVAAEQRAMEAQLNAQARAELTPRARRMSSATATVVSDVGSQLDANPRIARLVALADEKHCKGW